MFVRDAYPRIIKNSRGEKSIEIFLKSYEGKFASSAPSGKSRGKREAEPYNALGIGKSFELLKILCKIIKNKNFIIRNLDGLEHFENFLHKFEKKYGALGGNSWYAVETVFLKAAAADISLSLWEFIFKDSKQKKVKFPMPVGNCIGGGLHSKPVRGKRPDFQEFLLIPDEARFSTAITKNLKAYNLAGSLIKSYKRNDENAWRTGLSNEEVLEVLRRVADEFKLRVGVDVAASTFFKDGYYRYKNKRLIRDRLDQIEYITKLAKKYKIFYLEDPLEEEDFSGFKSLVEKIGKRRLIVGDDLTVTNPDILRRAIRAGAINAMIVKPNQVGSILKVKKVVEICRENNIKMVFSHRSGETMDDALAEYCIGFGGDYIKAGIYGRERLIKLKKILDVEKRFLG